MYPCDLFSKYQRGCSWYALLLATTVCSLTRIMPDGRRLVDRQGASFVPMQVRGFAAGVSGWGHYLGRARGLLMGRVRSCKGADASRPGNRFDVRLSTELFTE